jgi:hypothetical protein
MPKTSARELQARKGAWLKRERERRLLEAEHAALEQLGLSAEQIIEALPLFQARESPAMRFVCDGLIGVTVANLDDEMHKALLDLLASNTPLDPQWRQWMFDWFSRPRPRRGRPRATRGDKRRAFVAASEGLKQLGQDRGMTALDAEEWAADILGTSVDAARSKKRRAK